MTRRNPSSALSVGFLHPCPRLKPLQPLRVLNIPSPLRACACPCRRYQLMPLHSMVAPAEQRRVFVRPPPGVRKIVMATNIGECAGVVHASRSSVTSTRIQIE